MCSPAVDGDGPLLAELLLGLVHLADEVYEALARLGHPLLRPVGKVKLADGPRLAVPSVGHLKSYKNVVQLVGLLATWL